MEKLHVKSGDTVVVLSGESKGVRVKYETVVVDGKKTKKRLCAKCGAEIK